MYRRLLCSLCGLICYANSFKIEIKVAEGKLFGTTSVTVFEERVYYAFYRVPYANPPVGKLRFKDPQPIKKWKSVLDASAEYHGACVQPHVVHKQALYGVEDCLYLNIYTPIIPKDDANLKTVIVWIHGHTFTSSFSHIHGPDFFIENDVVLITATHRIGVFGFLKINDTDHHANMGLKDIAIALKWIRKNAHKFGGDKNNVVLMGSGSGAAYISLLLLTETNNLFHKIILQSGSMFSPSLFQNNFKQERRKLIKNLRKTFRKSIRNATTKELILASLKVYSKLETINAQKPLIPFLPGIENKSNSSLLNHEPDYYYDMINNLKRFDKPTLIGFNSQESISEIIPFLQNPRNLRVFGKRFPYLVPFSPQCKVNHNSSTYKEITDKIKTFYFNNGISEKSLKNFLEYSTDLIVYPIYKLIQRQMRVANGKLYAYKFDYVGNFSVVRSNSLGAVKTRAGGASTGDEVCYLLKCEPIWDLYVKAKKDNDKDGKFIKQITKLWTNFAKTGVPTPLTRKESVTWPPTTLNDNLFYLGKEFGVVNYNKERTMYSFWNSIQRKYYEKCSPHDEL